MDKVQKHNSFNIVTPINPMLEGSRKSSRNAQKNVNSKADQ
jgi:hypothetical protein